MKDLEKRELKSKRTRVKARTDYLVCPYINGVVSANGDLVIRPLNEEELDFLNKFQSELVHANTKFDEKDTVHPFKTKEDSDKLKAKRRSIKKEINNKISKIIKLKQRVSKLMDRVEILRSQYDEVIAKDFRKLINDENNSRNACIYNKLKSKNSLIFLGDNIDRISSEE
jgi:hypothetical protein